MTKPTGRPKGHPKKYDSDEEKPLTISLRVPRDLAEPLRRYARAHRQSVTELIMDGIRWRLSEGDPRGNGLVLPPVPPHADEPYYDNTVEQRRVLSEMHAMLASLSEAVASGALAAPPPHSRNTGIHESAVVAVEPRAPVAAVPAQPVAAAGYGSVTPAVLAALTQQPQAWTCDALAKALQAKNKAVHQVLDRLVQRGQVQKQGSGSTATYTLAPQA